ncbi:MAG: hypothetical protein V1875_09130 [Candidatus Altiarchaeota archaeon]
MYLILAAAAVLLATSVGYVVLMDRASLSADSPEHLESVADGLAEKGDCDGANLFYVRVVKSMDPTGESRIKEVFKKFCDCQVRLGLLERGLCVLSDSGMNLSIVARYD